MLFRSMICISSPLASLREAFSCNYLCLIPSNYNHQYLFTYMPIFCLKEEALQREIPYIFNVFFSRSDENTLLLQYCRRKYVSFSLSFLPLPSYMFYVLFVVNVIITREILDALFTSLNMQHMSIYQAFILF